MAKVKFTAGRIAALKCDESKAQAFLWCNEVPGLGIRVTPNSLAKGYIFQSKVKGKSMRVTIGKVSMWSIPEAQAEARRLQIIIDNGNDPRQVKTDKESAKIKAKAVKESEAAALVMQESRESVTVGMRGLSTSLHGNSIGPRVITMTMKKICTLAGLCEVSSTELTKPGTRIVGKYTPY